MIQFQLKDSPFIPLCDLLKITGLCETGGEAKQIISLGKVLVNGAVETRKRCKIIKGSRVKYKGQEIEVK